mmetsp:Transcript_31776/g.67302  ORF Transcript_31776/g.67302 Transcript_31776/m.67302 type:complete len:88 (+) Transcript_31776:1-264(+)
MCRQKGQSENASEHRARDEPRRFELDSAFNNEYATTKGDANQRDPKQQRVMATPIELKTEGERRKTTTPKTNGWKLFTQQFLTKQTN